MGWVDSREVLSLNGSWKFLVDPMQVGTPGSLFGGWRLRECLKMNINYSNIATRMQRHTRARDFNTQFDELSIIATPFGISATLISTCQKRSVPPMVRRC